MYYILLPIISAYKFKTCTWFKPVYAGPIASPLAAAGGQSFCYFCLSAHSITIDVVKFSCQPIVSDILA